MWRSNALGLDQTAGLPKRDPGRCVCPFTQAVVFLTLGFLTPVLALAADTTPPTTPVVTDDGTSTTSTTQLHATWTSADPESGIAESQYLIRQDSTSGTILVTWTSTGPTASVTRTGLSLIQGKRYYFGVKAKNGAGLWSAVGYSNGISVDTTAPSAPGQPKEGSSTTDYDYDGDGSYTVYWPAASDPDSGVSAYEVQERLGASGPWTSLTTTRTSPKFSVSGRVDKTQYVYQVRAKNGAGLWSPWSASSDGILVDKTAPLAVSVTDDGATTSSITTLHATWTASSDPESGIMSYEYLIRQDSTSGTIIVPYTSVGTATEVTRTGLSLIVGKTYYLGVRAKNGAARYSSIRYSNGILVQADTTPPVISFTSPTDGQILVAP
ncbi:MAG: fibronectin type III domain-containing protein [Candidatus Omnitrophica bacterium]|nr:fibronectin type III domain-containing protein [Candidatus Omnitrophota bacterium]